MAITDITKAIQGYTNALREIYPDLNSDEINFISSKVTVTKLKANQLYLIAGNIQESLGFAFEGLLRTFYIDDKGEEITISFTKENNFATDYGAFISQNPSKYYIETLESCLLVNVPFTLMEECYAKYKNFSEATSVSILTAGLLGEQFIGLHPGFMDESVETLLPGDFIEDTKPALVLEELIGQFLFSQGSDD